jgi:hypothetical protein
VLKIAASSGECGIKPVVRAEARMTYLTFSPCIGKTTVEKAIATHGPGVDEAAQHQL